MEPGRIPEPASEYCSVSAGCVLLMKELLTGLVKLASGGVRSTKKLDETSAMLPALSATVTRRECAPSPRPVPAARMPVVEALPKLKLPVTSAPSRNTWIELVSMPEAESEYCASAVGVETLIGPAGATMVSCGLMVSTRIEFVARPILPVRSATCAVTVCVPSASGVCSVADAAEVETVNEEVMSAESIRALNDEASIPSLSLYCAWIENVPVFRIAPAWGCRI